jgi:hypothetical protein
MNTDKSSQAAPEIVTMTTPNHPTVSWGAIIAGTFAAIAVQIGLAELCLAFGLALYQPADSGSSASTSATVAAIAGIICALAALFFGGWVAGRLAHYHSRMIAGLHGTLVWATGALVATALFATAVGALAGGTISLVGDGLAATARTAAAAAPAATGIVAPTWDAIKKQVEDAVARVDAANATGANATESRLSDQSRLMDLLSSAFSLDPRKRLPDADREELVTLLGRQAGISREAAQKTYDQWQSSWGAMVARYENAKNEAAEKAKQAAIVAKDYTTRAAALGFALMLIGALAAAGGGVCGSMCYRREDRRLVETVRGGVSYA